MDFGKIVPGEVRKGDKREEVTYWYISWELATSQVEGSAPKMTITMVGIEVRTGDDTRSR